MDSPLTKRGRDRSHALGRRLVREGRFLSAIHASDLVRAAETAEILAAKLSAPVRLDPPLREYDVGVLTGLTGYEIEPLYADIWHAMRHSSIWVSIPEFGDASLTVVGFRSRGPVLTCLSDTCHLDGNLR